MLPSRVPMPGRRARRDEVPAGDKRFPALDAASLVRVLVGREKELAVLTALLEQARAGHGAAVVVHGEPGIGKSALLDHLAAESIDRRVLRATGVAQESEFGYATLHQLLLPILDEVDRLPQPLAAALRIVFGLAVGPPPGRFRVGLATLSLLSELAGEGPVLCLVDDAHWTDRPSREVLEFVARRLDTEPIALVLTSRTAEHPPGVLELPLRALDREAATRLLIERTGSRLSAAERDAVLDATAGNPLAILELPDEVVRDGVPPSTPLLLAERLRAVFRARVEQLTESQQRLLLLIATAGQLRLDVLARAATEFDSAAAELGALDEFVVETGAATIAFRHPLLCSAVYHGASAAGRRDAHRALAVAMSTGADDIERRAWHLGQSVDGPDEELAEQLDRAAEVAARTSSVTSAVLFARAGELSTDGSRRSRRCYESAAAWWYAGDLDRAGKMLDLIDREGPLDDSLRRDVTWLRASVELHTGMPADAVAMLRPLIPAVLETEPQQAIPLLMLFGEAGYHANLAAASSEVVEIAEQLPLTGSSAHDALLRLFRGAFRVRAGKAAGLSPGDVEIVAQLSDPALLCWASGILWGLGDRARGRELNRAAVRNARRIGAVGILVWALERAVSDDIAGGRFRSAEASAEEGYRLATEIGQLNASCWHRGALALLAALQGQEERARDLAYEVLAEAVPRRLVHIILTARRALGLIDLAAGRAEAALAHLQPPGDLVHPGVVVAFTPDLVEAAAQAGKTDLAARALEPLVRRTASAHSSELRAVAARCQALLAAPDAAADEFRRALALHESADQPMEYGRTQLLFGEFLRRRRRKAEARDPLRAAFEIFRSLGAHAWAERARAELRAAGEAVETASVSIRTDKLTPQEMRIVEAVAAGCTNREIAAQMFLSARTVDYHLRKIFDKLKVRSRGELIRVVLTEHELPS